MMNNSEISNFPAEKKFLIAAVVGSAFVVLASVAPQQSEDLFWMLARVLGTFVSLLVMIMYAASIYKDPVSGEEQADGFYYLGFTFTLVALVAALPKLDEGGSNITTVFAIALLTTVVGLVGRIFLITKFHRQDQNDLSYSIEDINNETRFALKELRVEIKDTVQTLRRWSSDADKHWHALRDQELEEVRKILVAHQDLTDKQAVSLQAQHETSMSNITAASQEAANQVSKMAASGLGDIETAAQSTGERIQGVFNEIAGQLGQLAQKVQEDIDLNNKSMASLNEEFRKSALSSQQAFVSESEAMSDNIKSLSQQFSQIEFDKLNGAMENIFSGSKILGDKIADTGTQLASSFPSASDYQPMFEALNTLTTEIVKQNREISNRLQSATEETTEHLAELNRELKEGAGHLNFLFHRGGSVMGSIRKLFQWSKKPSKRK